MAWPGCKEARCLAGERLIAAARKLYAVRDKSGKFKDIQTYKRAHAADLRKTSNVQAAKRKTTKKAEEEVVEVE